MPDTQPLKIQFPERIIHQFIFPYSMTLEDHIGDIIRKGRLASNIPAATAAKTAGLTEAQLATLEESGSTSQHPNYTALASLLGMNPAKLEGIAKGWLPQQPDLSLWRELRQIVTRDESMSVNAYLVWDEVTREAALFDTGFDVQPVFDLVEQNGLTLKHLFLTHLHEDHVGGMEAIRARYPKIHLHASTTTFLPQHRNRSNDFIQLGSLRLSNRETPGHSPEGTSYIVGNWPEDAAYVVIVGDALFAGSMGKGIQSWDLARQKVREQILTLPPDTLICPGHGPWTTVAEEKAHNPFF
jgi:glyoxylase-like metal-dependent hydrolase (beta-lactamase superfamily II)